MIPAHVVQIYQSSWPTTPSTTRGRGTRWTSAVTWCPTRPPPCSGEGNASPSPPREQPTYGCTSQRASLCSRWVNTDDDERMDRESFKEKGPNGASSLAFFQSLQCKSCCFLSYLRWLPCQTETLAATTAQPGTILACDTRSLFLPKPVSVLLYHW